MPNNLLTPAEIEAIASLVNSEHDAVGSSIGCWTFMPFIRCHDNCIALLAHAKVQAARTEELEKTLSLIRRNLRCEWVPEYDNSHMCPCVACASIKHIRTALAQQEQPR